MEKIIDALVDDMGGDDLWLCLDSDDPTETFIGRTDMGEKLANRLRFHDKYINHLSEALLDAWTDYVESEDLILEDLESIKVANGWV